MKTNKKQKLSRITICVPVSCLTKDTEGDLLAHHMCIAREIDNSAIRIQTFLPIDSEFVDMNFYGVGNIFLKCQGKIVDCSSDGSGKYMLKITPLGELKNKLNFIKDLVRYHYLKKETGRVNISKKVSSLSG
jgi:hypothetical protein